MIEFFSCKYVIKVIVSHFLSIYKDRLKKLMSQKLFMKISSRFCLNAFTFFIFVFAFCVFDRIING